MKKILMTLSALILSMTFLAACTNQDMGMTGGAVVGGVAGSALTGGSTAGTIAGAVGGGYIGRQLAN